MRLRPHFRQLLCSARSPLSCTRPPPPPLPPPRSSRAGSESHERGCRSPPLPSPPWGTALRGKTSSGSTPTSPTPIGASRSWVRSGSVPRYVRARPPAAGARSPRAGPARPWEPRARYEPALPAASRLTPKGQRGGKEGSPHARPAARRWPFLGEAQAPGRGEGARRACSPSWAAVGWIQLLGDPGAPRWALSPPPPPAAP